MEKYFSDGTLSDEDVRRGLSSGLAENRFVPVLCGSGERDNGIVNLLNFITFAAPAPSSASEKGVDDKGNEISIKISENGNPSCFCFKTSIDQFSGRLSFVKVITGQISPETEVYNTSDSKKERITKTYTAQGKKLEDVPELYAGDIGIIAKMDSLHTNTTLCSADRILTYLSLQLPQPVHAVAIHAASKEGRGQDEPVLQKAAEDDLTFQIKYNGETKETVISGMGELHLSIILDRIRKSRRSRWKPRFPRVAIGKPSPRSEREYTQ
jgi:elongation factor G